MFDKNLQLPKQKTAILNDLYYKLMERLNRDHKRVLKMRGAMPSPGSILFLMGAVVMEKEYRSYSYPVSAFREIEELKRREKKRKQKEEMAV